MKIILDTNVFMSGIFWSGPPSKILELWQSKKIEIVLSTDILGEYTRVAKILSKKYLCLLPAQSSRESKLSLVVRQGYSKFLAMKIFR